MGLTDAQWAVLAALIEQCRPQGAAATPAAHHQRDHLAARQWCEVARLAH